MVYILPLRGSKLRLNLHSASWSAPPPLPPDYILARWVISEVKRPARDTETSFR